MESLFMKNLIFATHSAIPVRNSMNPIRIRRICSCSWKIHFKKSDFQDFQDYVKPSRLLPASDAKFCGDGSLENMLNQSKLDRSNSLYKVKLQTSSAFGSDLTDINSEVLLCLIDENGDSILQRISSGQENAHPVQSQGSDILHFRRDFQDYVKPSRLLPASDAKFCGDGSLENMLNQSKLDRSNSLYKVKLQTSSAFGSDLTDINSEVLLCLIDENGDSILQRISSGQENAHPVQSQGSDILHFRRDFQDYVKPSRLLPASDAKFCGDGSLENMLNQSKLDRSNSLYKVKLQTSSAFGSDLTDINSEVLLCLIDENGDSILQRISSGQENAHPVQSQGSDILHFRRDFQDYVKPSRLLPASDAKFCGDGSLENMLNQSKLDRSNSLYKVKLQTSSAFGSDLTDINSEVLLCLIDENGDSILQRISSGQENAHPVQSQGSDILHFRRGSVDEFIFEGPKLEKVVAVWISPESGQWRLGGMSITVISLLNSVSVGNEKRLSDCSAIRYDFDIEDVLLGEKSDSSMMEFKPCSATEFSQDNIVSLNEKTSSSASLSTLKKSNEDTMKEYADLKLSLLLYDVILTVAGSSIAYLAGEKSAIAFLVGGIGGFLYLLLVQRSVDGIPSSELTPSNRTETLDRSNKGFKGSISTIVLALAVTTVAARYFLGDVASVLTPKDLMLGTFGFLLCKVSVFLAAFQPIKTGLGENK